MAHLGTFSKENENPALLPRRLCLCCELAAVAGKAAWKGLRRPQGDLGIRMSWDITAVKCTCSSQGLAGRKAWFSLPGHGTGALGWILGMVSSPKSPGTAAQECPSLRGFKALWMWHMGTRGCGGLGSAGGRVGLSDLKSNFQAKLFHVSVARSCPAPWETLGHPPLVASGCSVSSICAFWPQNETAQHRQQLLEAPANPCCGV